MTRTQIQFTSEQIAALREQAAQLGVSISDIVRRAVDSWVRTQPGATPDELRRRAMLAAGKFGSGRSDIADRHDAYLAEVYRP
jgi:hypothetical protein